LCRLSIHPETPLAFGPFDFPPLIPPVDPLYQVRKPLKKESLKEVDEALANRPAPFPDLASPRHPSRANSSPFVDRFTHDAEMPATPRWEVPTVV